MLGENHGSFLVPMTECLANTTGPVLEVGVGDWSTPFLHRYCGAALRRLVSIDDNAEWYDRFKSYAEHGRVVALVNYDEYLPRVGLESWSVVLLDHWPAERRLADALLFRHATEHVLVHDWQKLANAHKAAPPEGWSAKIVHDTLVLSASAKP